MTTKRRGPQNRWSAPVADDVAESPQGRVYRLPVGKYRGYVRVKYHHDRLFCKPVGIFPAYPAGKVIFRQHLVGIPIRAPLPHSYSVPVVWQRVAQTAGVAVCGFSLHHDENTRTTKPVVRATCRRGGTVLKLR
jgi:hypothetical protein